MKRHSMLVAIGRFCLVMVMALATLLTPLPRAAHADGDDGLGQESRTTEAVWEGSGSGDEAEINRWWGAAGAMLCGAEARLILRAPAIGMNPYALAAGIAGCSLAALDIFTTE